MITEFFVAFLLISLIASILIWPIVIYRKLDRIEDRLESIELVALVGDDGPGGPGEDAVEQSHETEVAIGRIAA